MRTSTIERAEPAVKSSGVARTPERLAKALGWFSVGLGVPQILAPDAVDRFIGITRGARRSTITRAIGMREIAAATGILAKPRPGGFLFARVAGDVMDLMLLRAALSNRRNRRSRVRGAIAAVAGVTAIDLVAVAMNSRTAARTAPPGLISARTSITVNRSPEAVYGFWRALEHLPRFMFHLESVRVVDERRSHWIARGPAGARVEWDAEITDDIPNEWIAWRSIQGSGLRNSGSVRFAPAPGGRGTEVTVDLEYHPPAGAIGAAVARLFGEEPVQQIKDDLRRFKQVIETGEVVLSEGSPDGTRTQRQFRQREAQPLA